MIIIIIIIIIPLGRPRCKWEATIRMELKINTYEYEELD